MDYSPIGFLLLLVCLWGIGWGIAGVIGGMATTSTLRKIEENSINPKRVFWGWLIAMCIGEIVHVVSLAVFLSLADLFSPRAGSIAYGLAWCVTGAAIGSIGSNQMFSKNAHSNPDVGEK